MKTKLLLALLFPATFVTTAALADDKAACLDAAARGQRFKDNHKLVEARQQLRVCAAAACPAVVQSDCATWLAEVDAALPSVVVTAKNGAGADLIDVKVSMDGQLLVASLDGHAVAMNAGPHTFHFTAADGSTLDRQVVVHEGEKNQAVAVVLGAAPTPPARPPAPVTGPTAETPAAGTAPKPPSLTVETAPDSGGSSSTLRTIGWMLGAGGVVGLGIATIFGVIAVGNKNAANCVDNVCDPRTTSGIKSSALVSDIGWVAGGALLASGAGLLLFAPRVNHVSGAEVRVTPVVMASGVGIVTGRSW
ncbi:MAG TPA: hypothetical protein VGY54_05010 [Polyangiaceae bacterium]|jgi:hypothetical protein|nr:hypothetical protein [Polyangiaceae bacterium]